MKAATKNNHWSMGLINTMNDPEFKVKEDEEVVVIKDKYPKARHHFLVLPKKNIPDIWKVKREDEKLLAYMEKMAEELTKCYEDYEFIIGYHVMPSMHRLHLHVISTDFDSVNLKTKCHWNSFTTPFFLKSKDILKQLRENGELKKITAEESASYLKTELKCHRCSMKPRNMPGLKRHIITHLTKPK